MAGRALSPFVSLEAGVESEGSPVPQPGEYWTLAQPIENYGYGDDRDTVPEGTHMLVVEVQIIEGAFHSARVYVPAPYGTGNKYRSDTLTYTAAAFCEKFHRPLVSQDAIRDLRKAEMDEMMAEYRELPALFAGQMNRIAAPVAGAQTGSGNQGTLPVRADVAAHIEQVSKAMTQRSEKAVRVLEAATGELTAQVMAGMGVAKKMVGTLQQALQKIAAYAGEGVEVTQLLHGPRTVEPCPLTVYQDMRYMDEEYIVHVAEGGADHSDWEGFVEHLLGHPETLDRMCPARHGLFVMRYRRGDKNYHPGSTDARHIYEHVERNQTNKVGFLVYRDGGSAWRIDSPVTEHAIPHLFPTQYDLDKPFIKERYRGDGRCDELAINFEDLDYARAHDDHEKQKFSYHTLVLVLWGIQDRERLLAHLPDGRPLAQCVGDPACFSWVKDAEEGFMLGDGKDDLMDWLRKNGRQYLQSGARVFCDWRYLINKSCAPMLAGMAECRVLEPQVQGCSVMAARRDGEDFYVEARVRRRSYSSWEERESTHRIYFSRWRRGEDYRDGGLSGQGYLVLDAVTLADVEHYIHSKRARVHYCRYIDTFQVLRDVLRKEEDEQAGMLETLLTACGRDAEPMYRRAVRTWRASRRGKPVPQPTEPGFMAVREEILGLMQWGEQESRPAWAPVDAFAAASYGRGRLVTYHNVKRLREPLFPQTRVRRLQWIRRKSGKMWLERENPVRYTQPLPAQESPIWEDAGRIPAPAPCRWMDRASPAQRERLEAFCAATDAAGLLAGEVTGDRLVSLVKGLRREDRCWVPRVCGMQVLASRLYRRHRKYGDPAKLVLWLAWYNVPERAMDWLDDAVKASEDGLGWRTQEYLGHVEDDASPDLELGTLHIGENTHGAIAEWRRGMCGMANAGRHVWRWASAVDLKGVDLSSPHAMMDTSNSSDISWRSHGWDKEPPRPDEHDPDWDRVHGWDAIAATPAWGELRARVAELQAQRPAQEARGDW